MRKVVLYHLLSLDGIALRVGDPVQLRRAGPGVGGHDAGHYRSPRGTLFLGYRCRPVTP